VETLCCLWLMSSCMDHSTGCRCRRHSMRRMMRHRRGRKAGGGLVDHPMQRLGGVTRPECRCDGLCWAEYSGLSNVGRRGALRRRWRRERPRRVLPHHGVRQVPQRQPLEALLRRPLVVSELVLPCFAVITSVSTESVLRHWPGSSAAESQNIGTSTRKMAVIPCAKSSSQRLGCQARECALRQCCRVHCVPVWLL